MPAKISISHVFSYEHAYDSCGACCFLREISSVLSVIKRETAVRYPGILRDIYLRIASVIGRLDVEEGGQMCNDKVRNLVGLSLMKYPE